MIKVPDITSNKVAIPAALFLALSPGVLVTPTGTKVAIANGKTSQAAIMFHALVFFLVYSLVAKAMKIVLTRTDLLVTTALFILLSPGLLLTLPPGAAVCSSRARLLSLLPSPTPWCSPSSSRFCVANFLNTIE